jgi:hypothetical protein
MYSIFIKLKNYELIMIQNNVLSCVVFSAINSYKQAVFKRNL